MRGRRDIGRSRFIAWLLCIGCMVLAKPAAGAVAQQEAGLMLSSPEAPPDHSPSAAAAYFTDYVEARTLYDAGRWSEAAALLKDLTATYSGDAQLWFALARASERLGDGAGAIDADRAALALGFRFEPYLADRGARLHAVLRGSTRPAGRYGLRRPARRSASHEAHGTRTGSRGDARRGLARRHRLPGGGGAAPSPRP